MRGLTMYHDLLSNREINKTDIAWALARLVILISLFAWAFRPEVNRIFLRINRSSEMAHATIAPIAIILLLYLRKGCYCDRPMKSSSWGILLILAGLTQYALATWPFSYGYIRDIAMIPALAGIIMVACGTKATRLSVPVLLIILLAIPIGSRLYATLIIHPETYTISAAARILDTLPKVDITQTGPDIFFRHGDHRGVVALAESNRAAKLLLLFASMGIFITFSVKRSLPRLTMIAIAAFPIVLMANFIRFLLWALIEIYFRTNPTSPLPRNLSAVCSMLALYGMFAFVCAFKLNLFEEVPTEETENG